MKNKDKNLLCPNSECFNIPEILYIYNPLDSLIKYKCSFHNNGKNEYQKEQIATYRIHKNYNLVSLIDYQDINNIDEFLNKDVYVDKEELNVEYLLSDLIDCEIIDTT